MLFFDGCECDLFECCVFLGWFMVVGMGGGIWGIWLVGYVVVLLVGCGGCGGMQVCIGYLEYCMVVGCVVFVDFDWL